MSRQFESLVDMAEDSFRRFSSRPLFGKRRNGTWSWMTYLEVATLVDELRGGLAELGVRAGERVAIVSRNSPVWAAAAYASYGLGAVFVPMYEAQGARDWELILRDCAASVVFGRSPEIVAALDEMRPRLPALRQVIAVESSPNDARSLDAVRRSGGARPVEALHPASGTLAGLIYTSGTTGQPKGVMLTHRNFVSNVVASTEVFPFGTETRTLSFLPWAHAYGQIGDLHILISAGSSTAINEDIERLSEDIAEVRPTMLIAVPRIFNKLYAGVGEQIAARPRAIRTLFELGLSASIRRRRGLSLAPLERLVYWVADRLLFAKVRARLGGRLQYALSASAALSFHVAEFMDALGIEIYEGYGLTETSPVVSANCPGARKLGSVGRAIPGVTLRIDESRASVPGQGEIVVYGPNVMKGYHARPEEDAKVFTADGGLLTGDIGYLDGDGYLFITGRIKEQYKLENGKYVMPSQLEEQIELSPYIMNVMFYGENRPHNVALVVIDAAKVRAWAAEHGVTGTGGDLTQLPAVRELITAELTRLSSEFKSYERARAFVLTTEELTTENDLLTPTLKLKRRNVVSRYHGVLDALYRADEQSVPQRASTSARVPRVAETSSSAAERGSAPTAARPQRRRR